MIDQLVDLFRTTHKVKTQQVARNRGQQCGEIELVDYLEEIETRLTRDGGIAPVDVLLNIRNAIGVHDRTIAPVDEFGEIAPVDVFRAK